MKDHTRTFLQQFELHRQQRSTDVTPVHKREKLTDTVTIEMNTMYTCMHTHSTAMSYQTGSQTCMLARCQADGTECAVGLASPARESQARNGAHLHECTGSCAVRSLVVKRAGSSRTAATAPTAQLYLTLHRTTRTQHARTHTVAVDGRAAGHTTLQRILYTYVHVHISYLFRQIL